MLLDEVGCCRLLFVLCCVPLRALLGACLGAAARKGASLGLSRNESCRGLVRGRSLQKGSVSCVSRDGGLAALWSSLGGDAAVLDLSFGFPPRCLQTIPLPSRRPSVAVPRPSVVVMVHEDLASSRQDFRK